MVDVSQADARPRNPLQLQPLPDLATTPALLAELAQRVGLGKALLVEEAFADQGAQGLLHGIAVQPPAVELVAHLLMGALLPGAVAAGLFQGLGIGQAFRHAAKIVTGTPMSEPAFRAAPPNGCPGP